MCFNLPEVFWYFAEQPGFIHLKQTNINWSTFPSNLVPSEIFANCHLNREVVEKLSGHRHRHQEQVASLEFDDNDRWARETKAKLRMFY